VKSGTVAGVAPRKYEQRLRAESSEATRGRILDALEQRLREAPTEPVSMDEIATRAAVARTTVYLTFGSRAGLFDALATELWNRAGLANLTEAVAHPDAREHLRGGLRAGVEIFVALRDVAVALFSMSALDPESVGGAMVRLEERRWGGMEYLAQRLGEQGQLRADVTVEEAADVLWVLAGFASFDALYTGRGMTGDQVARTLTAMAERTLCRDAEPAADA
jgi:AcrR family transcriptional regulator